MAHLEKAGSSCSLAEERKIFLLGSYLKCSTELLQPSHNLGQDGCCVTLRGWGTTAWERLGSWSLLHHLQRSRRTLLGNRLDSQLCRCWQVLADQFHGAKPPFPKQRGCFALRPPRRAPHRAAGSPEPLELHRITERSGLAGTSVGPPAQPPAQAGSPRAGCTAPRPGRS